MVLRWTSLHRVLCLGAHADDIEIGCGGTILKLLEVCPEVEITWVVLSGDACRAAEARRSFELFCGGAQRKELVQHSFRDSFFPAEGEAIKESLHALAARLSPDLVFTHHLQDRHQDHRAVAELTWNVFRGSTILQYEVPKWEGDLGQPNVYVPLERELVERKAACLLQCFPSQASKAWFDRETFLGLARLRGVEAGSPTRYAEAFHGDKLVVSLDS
jgi:LmbE family N-acetylglucosaminyl deacetylase